MCVRVAHLVDEYLPISQNWIAPIVAGQGTSEPTVFSIRSRTNADAFPVGSIEALEGLGEETLLAEARFLKRHGHVRRFREVAERRRVQVLHAHFGDVGVRGLGLARRLRVPLVTSFYGYDLSMLPKHPAWADALSALFAAGDRFVVEGSHARHCLVELGCPPDRIDVVRFGIDPGVPFTARSWKPGDTLRVLLPARLVEKKGTTFALESLALFRARRPDVRVAATLVGDGPEHDRVFDSIKRLGLSDVVDTVPFWTHDEFVTRLRDYHVLLQHSVTAANGDHEGGAPVSLLEGQASGALVVATRHADIPEYVLDGVSGVLVPERDTEACARAIQGLLERAADWPAMGRAGHDHVRSRYAVTAQLDALADIYGSLAGRYTRRPLSARQRSAARWADLLWLGAFFHNRGHYDDSRRVFEGILQRDPGNADARFKLAVAALRRHRGPRGQQLADLMADHVARLQPAAALQLARDAANWPRHRGLARELVASLLVRCPDYAPGLYLKAGLDMTSGDRLDALATYRRIVATSDDPLFVGGAHFHLAEDLLSAGESDAAREAYQACLREIPNHRKAVERLLAIAGTWQRIAS